MASTNFVKRPCGHLQTVPWHYHVREDEKKTGQHTFFKGQIPFFSKIYFFNNLLGVTEMSSQLAQ